LDQPNHMLPTEQGDYVMLVRPTDTTPPNLSPAVAVAHSMPVRAAAQAEAGGRSGAECCRRPTERPLPLPPLQRVPPPVSPAPKLLQGVLETRPLLPPQGHAALGGAVPPAPSLGYHAPTTALRVQAREDSVSRLRRAVQRADEDLAAALRDSEHTAAAELARGSVDAGIPRPQTSQEEEAQLLEAIRASELEASSAACAVVAPGQEGRPDGCAAAPETTRSKAAGKAPMARVHASDNNATVARRDDARSDCGGASNSSSGNGSSDADASALSGMRPSSSRSHFDAPIALRPLAGLSSQCAHGLRKGSVAHPEAKAAEERRQLEKAIAQSVREAECRAADERHDRQVMLRGYIDSLGQTRTVAMGLCRGDATTLRRRERDIGREMARKALEQHLASGAIDI